MPFRGHGRCAALDRWLPRSREGFLFFTFGHIGGKHTSAQITCS